LAELDQEEAEKVAWLARDQAATGRVLMALERLARHPPTALVARPLNPVETVRAGILLRAAVGEIERRAGKLRRELEALAAIRSDGKGRRHELRAALEAFDQDQRTLNAALGSKAILQLRASPKSRPTIEEAHRLSREAGDLKELVEGLEDENATREPVKTEPLKSTPSTVSLPSSQKTAQSIVEARGKLPYPAVGRVVGRYGETTDTGLTSKGISIETRPEAQVISPHDGRVVFAGPFRGYGQLLIIDHGEGYHSLLAGLARIQAVIGQQVFAGEPVGTIGRPNTGRPTLYLEFRQNNQPVDPLPWLVEHEMKVSG
jgi:septal ring factor EnvC (AmiA/AmiB activator)